ETDAERARRVAEYPRGPWAGLQSDIPTDPLITDVPANAGSGRARGLEGLVTRRPRSAETRVSGWGSFTPAKADRETYGLTYPFDYDRRHAVTLVGDWRFSARLTASVAMQAAAGFPVTIPNGVKVAPDVVTAGIGGQTFILPLETTSGLVYMVD